MRFDDEPVYRCPQCLDVDDGWIELTCSGSTCERTKEHQAHTFAVRCPCWLRANKDLLTKLGQEAIAEGKEPGESYRLLQAYMDGRYRWEHVVTIRAQRKRERYIA